MPRYAKILIGIVLSVVLVLAVALTVAATFNWNMAKPWVERQLSALSHRQVDIQGDLKIDWKRPVERSGWRGWVPWPEITAHDIRVGQPQWTAGEEDMAHAGRLNLLVDPIPLLSNTVRVARLELQDADLDLVRSESGAGNWALSEEPTRDDEPAKWQFTLQQLGMQNVRIRLRDPSLALDVRAQLDSLADTQTNSYAVGWQAEGRYKEGTISGSGKAGGLLSLQQGSPDADVPFPIQAVLKIGDTTAQFEGTVTRPTQFAALDLRLNLEGATMADLNPLIGIALPNTPPYQTEGRLVGELANDKNVWHYQDFKGKVGSSDLSGTVEFHVREPRSFLTGSLQSELLRFKDLGPLVGVDKREDKAKNQPADKALPVEPINTDSWGLMDADVRFKGKQIVRNENLPLDNVETHVKLDNKVLTLTPLNFGVAGGTLRTTIELNGRQDQIKARLKATARGLQLRKLLRGAESMRASLGTVQVDAALSSQGKSFAELLGEANGELKAVVTKGTVSHFLLEAAGLNVADMVIVKLFGDEQVVLNCVAADFDVKNGLMHTKAFKLDTEDATIDVTGNINLATEELDLDIDPENKSLRIFTLRTPLYVRGTFKDPDVGVHEGPIAARAGAAVALGIIATPLAALIPLLNLGTDDSNECAPLMKTAQEKPEAPPPGKQR
ncbi:AsmA family protein [Pusillimonas sp.]|uniref:AsmA family protein n=1 Tax=Pusillimonas sp. TaxID=3040095 RepID=UPI0037CA18BB